MVTGYMLYPFIFLLEFLCTNLCVIKVGNNTLMVGNTRDVLLSRLVKNGIIRRSTTKDEYILRDLYHYLVVNKCFGLEV